MTAALNTSIKPELRAEPLHNRRCWRVGYRFCELLAEVVVYAENETDALTKAADQLRRRGLKLTSAA